MNINHETYNETRMNNSYNLDSCHMIVFRLPTVPYEWEISHLLGFANVGILVVAPTGSRGGPRHRVALCPV